MNTESSTFREPGTTAKAVGFGGDWTLFLFTTLCGLLAISSESFWIDEGNSALRAIQPTWREFVHLLVKGGGSDAQMPLYMAWLWLWEKGFGRGEFVLRLANLPWWMLANGALLLTARRLGGMQAQVLRAMIVLASVSPFLWHYLNEARPYIMQYAGATLLFAFLLEITQRPSGIVQLGTLWMGAIGAVILTGSSLLGIPWLGCAGAITLWVIWRHRSGIGRPGLGGILVTLASSIAIAGFGVYFVFSRAEGGGASQGSNSIANLLFVGYEMIGLAGLGPDRGSLRAFPLRTLLPPFLPALTAGFLLITAPLLAGGYVAIKKRQPMVPRWLYFYLLPPIAATLLGGIFGNVRLLGRHFMPAFPVFLWLAALLLVAFIMLKGTQRARWYVAMAAGLLITWSTSSAILRWSGAHHRDDYRSAADAAHEALRMGKSVVWAADVSTAIYYQLPAKTGDAFHYISCPQKEELEAITLPDLVILSKPDLYDRDGVISQFLKQHRFSLERRLPGFTLHRRNQAD